MSANYLRRLYAMVPGFKHDKDEQWMHYLPLEDQTFIRRCREKFIIMKDRLDELKLQQKDIVDSKSQEYLQLGQRMLNDARAIDEFINTCLVIKLPQLKRRAESAQEKLIEDDFSSANEQPDPLAGVFGGQFATMASSFDAFLPSHLLPPPEPASEDPEPGEQEPPEEQVTSTRAAEPEPPRSEEPRSEPPVQRDTYFDGVDEENREIMRQIRPFVERLDCKDRVLATLKKVRHRDHWMDILDSIKRDFPLQDNVNSDTTSKNVPLSH